MAIGLLDRSLSAVCRRKLMPTLDEYSLDLIQRDLILAPARADLRFGLDV